MKTYAPSAVTGMLLALGLVLPLRAQKTEVVPAPEGWRIQEVVLEDGDGDGLADLWLCQVTLKKPYQRRIAWHRARTDPARFSPEADALYDLLPGVVGIALADVDRRPGRDLILFSARTAVALVPGATGADRYRTLFPADFLWQLPDDEDVVVWVAGIRDLNGDGRDDLVIPEPGRLLVALQVLPSEGPGTFPNPIHLDLPPDPATADISAGALKIRGRGARREIALKVGVGDDDGQGQPLVEINESVPNPILADFDGDGHLDVTLRTIESLCVWRAEGPGQYRADPTLVFPIPVVLDTSRLLDVSYRAHLEDLDGDHKADCVFVAGNTRSKNPSAQVLVYIQGRTDSGPRATTPDAPLFGPKGFPRQLFNLSGFVGSTSFGDVDGNGRPDFLATTFEPDLVDRIRSSSGNIDLGFSVFLNRDGEFTSPAELVSHISIRAKSIDSGRDFFQLQVLPDCSGDGIAELLIQDEPSSFRIQPVVRRGGRLSLDAPPLLRVSGRDGSARVYREAKGGLQIVFHEQEQVQHVRFVP